ncbi:MAG: hypothetical protein M1817_005997 [Caeruleum heppii]|nr:MAG: hypothetical protein M1817_005997 [Caeruleum heppii]
MPSLRSLIVLALSVCVLTSAADSVDADREAFEALLNTIPSESLHAALHGLPSPRYDHGVFQDDRTAIEAVRRHNAAAATSLVRMAKRQGTNQTAVVGVPSDPAPTPQTSFSSPEASQGQSSNSPPTPTGTTTPQSSTQGASPSASSSSSVFNGEGSSTDGSPTTEAPDSASEGSAATVVVTSTFANGERSTITAVTVVGGADSTGYEPPSGTAGAAQSTGTAGRPGLQTNAAVARHVGAREVVAGGLLIGAMIL